MNFHVPERPGQHPAASRRQQDAVCQLVLSELNPLVVIDYLDGEEAPLTLLTFGNVREACPKCQQANLKLVLRQTSVRIAHLFCTECEACFDARYADGAPALAI